ncbi:MAG TPA: Gfo/Idh/MocA family oxidoreductase, partial [Chitinophagaceae bacterium]
MSNNWSRRDALKALGLASFTLPLSSWATNEKGEKIILPDSPLHKRLANPVTAITLGAGSRGNVYGNYAVQYPGQLDIIGVAEPIPIRNERYSKKHKIPEANRFKTWEDVFKRPKFADAVIISTPDRLHYGPCMEALKMGYDVL